MRPKEEQNIVLVGMPGCGKTRIGEAVAALMGRPFVDTDQVVAALHGSTPAQIIQEQGEEAFRRLETQAVQLSAAQKGVVIATGGGAVLRECNRTVLRECGQVYFLHRALELLSTQERPLSRDLYALYQQRLPAYQSAAHWEIHNMGTVEEAAQAVIVAFLKAGKGKEAAD